MDDKTFHPVTGSTEMAEPSNASVNSPLTLPNLNLQPSTTKKLYSSQTSSRTSSPRNSRETSPVRPSQRPGPPRRVGSGRIKKPGSQEASPSRPISGIAPPPQSSSTTQKPLSATTVPQLGPSQPESSINAPVPQKTAAAGELRDVPRWPISPRLRSPPPVQKPAAPPRKVEQDLPVINVHITATGVEGTQSDECEDSQIISGIRTPVRGVNGAASTLETVQEISQPNTPAVGLPGAGGAEEGHRPLPEQDNSMGQALARALKQKPPGANESGSESGGNKGDTKMRSTTSQVSTLRSTVTTKTLSSSTAGRGKSTGEGSAKNMIVETETVSSIPQVAVGGGAGVAGTINSLRAKPSSETIRPKKEKKRASRKAPSASGIASSKADIFEAKIASAVDEADSSDSGETFVYESNPPESNERQRPFHSRTPSTTSMVSQVDQRGNGRLGHGMDTSHIVTVKRSMKFAANSHNGPDSGTGEDDGKGTVRGNMGTGRGTAIHHIGRRGRNTGNGLPSLFDYESSFSNVPKSKFPGGGSRNSSQPSSPRGPSTKIWNGKKTSMISSGYDIDDGARADDEGTPLMGSMGSINRTRYTRYRRQPFPLRSLERQSPPQNSSLLNRFASCLVLTIMVLLVISGAIGFMFATTQPLSGVEVLALKDVIASEQEIMFDMVVSALNPNVIVITIDSVVLEVFAKSKHAGTDEEWWRHPLVAKSSILDKIPFLHDPPTDDDDDPNETPLLKLGSIYSFDSPLVFDGSPFEHKKSVAVGQLSLQNPGNTTEPAGSERWGRVLQYDFDLIVKGVLKYQLPMNQRPRSTTVEGRILIKPANSKVAAYNGVLSSGRRRGGRRHAVREIETP